MKHLLLVLTGLLVVATLFVASFGRADNPSIFMVSDSEFQWTGTAFEIWTARGQYTITNAHVCGKEEYLFAHFFNPRRLKILIVKAVYKKHDLCVLSSITSLEPLSLSDTYEKGDRVTVEGFPNSSHSITIGVVGKYDTNGGVENNPGKIFVEYLGFTDFGSSGSPVVNAWGKVVGIISIKDTGMERAGMVPLEYIKDFIDRLP